MIHRLSSNRDEDKEAASNLLSLANDSPGCRDEIIKELVVAMNRGLVEYNHSSFLLWSKGSAILGELKAVETLDLLIDNLNLSDGLFSASMAHQPVVLAVEKMGVLAVPKLATALKSHSNRDIRLAAALCLLDIGGSEALDALKSALSSETDQCVRCFITLSLPDPADGTKSKPRITAETGEKLMQRLLAFRCGN
ncbi:MAG TPA: HEAT repeat domain-containing protein [Pyrinomonadaceae bacterium]|nr:HEAT repeat domain-containing protein [Pyrinomonadaceae bacterium]